MDKKGERESWLAVSFLDDFKILPKHHDEKA